MNDQMDYYNVLQVHHDAEKDVIDAAYRCLSKMYHPDLNKLPMAAEKMKTINLAYGVIGNEESRRKYHATWLATNGWKTIAEKNSGFSWHRAENKEVFDAYTVIDTFFRETMNEKWSDAYEKLTQADREIVPFEEFREWKESVHQIYKLGNYSINYFRRYNNCEYGGKVYPKLFHFIVRVTELQQLSGQISEGSSHKYVALDEGALRVCLGNRNLQPSIQKYKQIAQVMPKNGEENEAIFQAIHKIDTSTGILSRDGWIEEADRELSRSWRYGNPLCFGVIGFSPRLSEDGKLPEDETLDTNMAYVAKLVGENLRTSDIIGRCSDLAVAIMFTETNGKDGRKAIEKIVHTIKRNNYIRGNFPCQITAMVKKPGNVSAEDSLNALLDKVLGAGHSIKESADQSGEQSKDAD